MKPIWTRPDTVQDGNQPHVRGRLVDLIRTGRRQSAFSKHRPTVVRPWEVVHPDTGLPLTKATMWGVIETLLDLGVPLEEIELRQPPGEKAWVFRASLSPESVAVYVKLQLFGSRVLLRSFHEAEYDDD